jgi:hypothetical protein
MFKKSIVSVFIFAIGFASAQAYSAQVGSLIVTKGQLWTLPQVLLNGIDFATKADNVIELGNS